MDYDISSFHPKKDAKPKHVGLIPDGTGRWATINGVDIPDAYFNASERIVEITKLFFDEGYNAVSLYLSSSQNFNRSLDKVSAFCTAQAKVCNEKLINLAEDYAAKVIHAGNLHLLTDDLRNSIVALVQRTRENRERKIYLCAAYNPLEEVLFAITQNPKEPRMFIKSLWVPAPLDIVIRTGAANVLSNFLPLQAGYARFYTIEKLFPDVTNDDYKHILVEFSKIARFFGD